VKSLNLLYEHEVFNNNKENSARIYEMVFDMLIARSSPPKNGDSSEDSAS